MFKTRELLITSGFDNSKSTPEFYEVVELNVQANDGTEIAIRAIVIDFLIDPLEDKYREKLLELTHLKNLNLAHPYTGEKTFQVDLLIGADFYWSFIGDEKRIRGQGPTAINSKISYLVFGRLDSVKVQKPVQAISLHIQTVEADD